MKIKKSWVDNPSKKQASLVFLIWFTGATLFIIEGTNFFTESMFYKKNWGLGMLILGSTFTMMPVCINYIKMRKGK